ncbi:hypothetical protein OOU_Y34scaffold00095g44 [Pyricularia oryzae Y34]|uniref:Uncharacterized protein n=2 Tax=Pyricularia oryzae TaxID=318829 RepID=A0AA97P962_PYRO3|nr:hypothetical protein OOU_Y34scaffold00095g44 [Pyricularia oryzae Y34]
MYSTVQVSYLGKVGKKCTAVAVQIGKSV